jgi:hypothetical protein
MGHVAALLQIHDGDSVLYSSVYLLQPSSRR